MFMWFTHLVYALYDAFLLVQLLFLFDVPVVCTSGIFDALFFACLVGF